DILRRAGVPVQRHIETAARCLGAAADFYAARSRNNERKSGSSKAIKSAQQILERCRQERRNPLEPEATEILQAHGIPVMPSELLRSAGDAQNVVKKLGNGPFAVKVVSADVLQKSDVGGVRLNVT